MKATLQSWWPNFWEFFRRNLSIIGVIRFYAGRVLRLVLQLFLAFLYDKDLERFSSFDCILHSSFLCLVLSAWQVGFLK
jgi:hypothetical protein